ncbi:MAG: radical SAM family heme chaperone HemW [Microscillaceae bacterium]|nr:radical SAM family heme chaperone HemW [Microscillaceae bacterium]
MASLYIHIPFCKQACYYCDFHFSTNLSLKAQVIEAICAEIDLQKDYLPKVPLNSVYFGGGTPSLLQEAELSALFTQIHRHFSLKPQVEITLECNPDDLNREQLSMLKRQGINRLSVGVQSFHAEHLKYLNRAHDSKKAYEAIQLAQDIGFENLSLDLIYGIPAEGHQILEEDLKKVGSLNPPHISAYCLTIEEKTVFGNWLKKNKIKQVEDEFAAQQFEILLNFLESSLFEQYEISNFARNQQYSQHNCNYWIQESYLGVGPGAHSYNQYSRQYNITNNTYYIRSINNREIPCTLEILTRENQINEYLMTSLRTIWGTDLRYLANKFDLELILQKKTILERYMQFGLIQIEDNKLSLTRKGKLLADEIIRELFVSE